MGFSSPRKQLQSTRDGMLNLHGKIVNLKSDKLRNYSISKSKKLLRKLTNHYPCLKVRSQRWTRTEQYYSNTLVFSQIRSRFFKAYCESIRSIITEICLNVKQFGEKIGLFGVKLL